MNRTSLFLLILGAVLLFGSAGYWLSSREKVSEHEATPSEAVEESRPSQSDTEESKVPSDPLPMNTTSDDEDTPKPVSENQKKFESEEETTDTDDSVTVEVELEEE
jgi:hypothetical protein